MRSHVVVRTWKESQACLSRSDASSIGRRHRVRVFGGERAAWGVGLYRLEQHHYQSLVRART